ncbi:F-box/kelch-repeat protein [Hibiscus syriacus]|uniref:F-box/kelch-repeat protein n=1 Tax=Hibiscus syriacus TaxID=106335 RepID=A0A6A3BHG6_HIBSY|nr:F-box/kelch-repeat protein At1g67480-like [Hibiscus syriacus]KAE8716154.1 F-box/kelch-repeat protein [Hibiscus syriacus]
MTGFEGGNKRTKGSNDCLTSLDDGDKFEGIPLLPGLPDDVAKYCLALVPRFSFPAMGGVCKTWRSFIQTKEFLRERTLAGVLEEWLYVLIVDSDGKDRRWEVFDRLGHERQLVPPMPGPAKMGFGVTFINGKLLCIAGYSVINGVASASPSPDVYRYDPFLNRWSKLADLNVARADFACAEVNGMVYVVGGYGIEGKSLSTVEVYDPETGKWTVIESLRRPRWGCFACGLNGKLYVFGGRSSFTIGNSRFVDVYDPMRGRWCEMKNGGCVMVTTHAVVEKKLFCIEWENQRKVAIFDPDNGSWKRVWVPSTGSTSVGFRLGNEGGKLLLFTAEGDQTLVYDPNATPGSEWRTSNIKPSGLCLCSVTIKA